MTYAAAILCIACFAAALKASGVFSVAAKAIETGRSAAKLLRDRALSDLEKEHAMQRSSVQLLGAFVSITARGALALLFSLAPAVVLSMTGLAQFSSVTHLLATWQGVVLGCIVMALMFFVRIRN